LSENDALDSDITSNAYNMLVPILILVTSRFSDPIALSNIITNLFSKSVAHGFESIELSRNEDGYDIFFFY